MNSLFHCGYCGYCRYCGYSRVLSIYVGLYEYLRVLRVLWVLSIYVGLYEYLRVLRVFAGILVVRVEASECWVMTAGVTSSTSITIYFRVEAFEYYSVVIWNLFLVSPYHIGDKSICLVGSLYLNTCHPPLPYCHFVLCCPLIPFCPHPHCVLC